MSSYETVKPLCFSNETIEFIKELRRNNNKLWFEENKQDFERYVLEPFKWLVKSMDVDMLSIDTTFEVRPSVNKTISRICRDTRFSKDKSPYKNAAWITFKKASKDWKTKPSYFFELCPNSYRYGMGFYSASKDTMDSFRDLIDTDTEKFLEEVSFFYN